MENSSAPLPRGLAMAEPAPIAAPPDLIIPTGNLRMTLPMETPAIIGIDSQTEIEVILSAGTEYHLPIGQCHRARWRLAELFPAGIWSFLCVVGDEVYWLEEKVSGDGWTINHNLPRLEDVTARPQASA